jgi:hypothetical protein
MFSLREIRYLIFLVFIAIGCVAAYFLVKGGTIAWLTGKPCVYGDVKVQNGKTYYDKSYDMTVKCVEGEITYE